MNIFGSQNLTNYKQKMQESQSSLLDTGVVQNSITNCTEQNLLDVNIRKNSIDQSNNDKIEIQKTNLGKPNHTELKHKNTAKDKKDRKPGRRKQLQNINEENQNNQNIGHLILPKMIELWSNMHQFQSDIINPLYSKTSPFYKNHLNVHVFWYITSSIYFTKNSARSEFDIKKVLHKINTNSKRELAFISSLMKFKKIDDNVQGKTINGMISEDKYEIKCKNPIQKRLKNFRLFESILNYLYFKKDFLSSYFGSMTKVSSSNCNQIIYDFEKPLLSSVPNQLKTKAQRTVSDDSNRIPEIDVNNQDSELQTKLQFDPFSKNESYQDPQVPIKFSVGSACIKSEKWSYLSKLTLAYLLEKIEEVKSKNSERLEFLLNKCNEKKDEHERRSQMLQGKLIKIHKKDKIGLFENLVKESDILYHCRMFSKFEEIYLHRIEDLKRNQKLQRINSNFIEVSIIENKDLDLFIEEEGCQVCNSIEFTENNQIVFCAVT